MVRTFLRTKLHRVTITRTDPNYEGSVSIDRAMCRAAGLAEFEQVDVLDIDNGARFTTYVIYGDPGEVQVNGAAARLVAAGHRAIVLAYAQLSPKQLAAHAATVVLVGEGNAVAEKSRQRVRKP